MVIEIDGNSCISPAAFAAEFNRAFAEFAANLGPYVNLNAFNDYMNWPLAVCDRYTFKWTNSAVAREYLSELVPGTQMTLFEMLVEIIRDNNDCCDLLLE